MIMHRIVPALLALAAGVAVAATPGRAHAKEGYLSETSYVAVGRGGPGLAGVGFGNGAYAASGFDVRVLDADGQGGFMRVEHGTPGFFDLASAPKGGVLAFDLGYSYGGPIVGGWGSGLLGFLELGVTGWDGGTSDIVGQRAAVLEGTRYGFGVAVGAALEGSVGPFRVGVAINRRDVPFFLDGAGAYASSTTVQLRLVGKL